MVAPVVALSIGLAFATSSGRARPAPVLAFLLVGQVLMHMLLTVGGGHGHAAASTGPATLTMVAAHVGAAVVATVVLVHADELIDRWGTLLASVLGWVVPLTWAPADPREATPATLARPDARTAPLRHQVTRRGPPVPRAVSFA
jgi:hypothetical protein